MAPRLWYLAACVAVLVCAAQGVREPRNPLDAGMSDEDINQHIDPPYIKNSKDGSDFMEDSNTDYANLMPMMNNNVIGGGSTDLQRMEDGYVDNQMAPGREPQIQLDRPAGAVGAPLLITVEKVGGGGDDDEQRTAHQCPKGCSGHGVCEQYETSIMHFCKCEKGFEPPDCATRRRTPVDVKLCPKGCMGHGECFQYEDSEHYFCECQEKTYPPFCAGVKPFVAQTNEVSNEVINAEGYPNFDFNRGGSEHNGSALVLAPYNASNPMEDPTLVRMSLSVNNTVVGQIGAGNDTSNEGVPPEAAGSGAGDLGHADEFGYDGKGTGPEYNRKEPSDDRILVTNLNHALTDSFNKSGDICTTFSACSTCIADLGCGWCASTGLCMAGKEPGSDAAKTCGDYRYTTCEHKKGMCSQYAQCGSCIFFEHCGWCGSTGTCMEGDKLSPTGQLCANWNFGTCSNSYLRALKEEEEE